MSMGLGKNIKFHRERLGWTLDELSVKSGVDTGTIGALEVRDSKRSMYAPELCAALGFTVEQLSNDHFQWDVAIKEISAEYVGQAQAASLMPVQGFAQLGTNGWYEEINAPGTEGYIEHPRLDSEAYVLRVRGDSMHPAVRNGWFVVVEPNRSTTPGEYVAIHLVDGRKMVKELLFQNGEEVTVESVNGGNRLTIRRNEIERIHAVGAIVPPSKHKNI